MRLNIEIKKWHAFIIVGAFLFLGASVFTYAQGNGLNVSHDASQIDIEFGSENEEDVEVVDLQQAIEENRLLSEIPHMPKEGDGLKDVGKIKDVGSSTVHLTSCVVLEDGKVRCSGYNNDGQLGTGDTSGGWNPTFVEVPSLTNVKEVEGGSVHLCAIVGDDREVKCWGYNNQGQLGDGTRKKRPEPVNVVNDDGNINGIDKIAITKSAVGDGYWDFNCALEDEGRVWCWGYNNRGQLGSGSSSYRHEEAQKVSNIKDAKDIEIGGRRHWTYACAIVGDDRGVKCWGYNNYGTLGNGDTKDKDSPVSVLKDDGGKLKGVESLELNNEGQRGPVCAILENGELWCWGYNYYGELGIGDKTREGCNCESKAKEVSGGDLENVIDVKSIGIDHVTATCALQENGEVKCWGYNGGVKGYVGSGDDDPSWFSTPQSVDLNNVKEIIGGKWGSDTGFFCALQENGEVKCWGRNNRGQFGAGNPGLMDTEKCGGGNTCYWSDVPVKTTGFGSGEGDALGKADRLIMIGDGFGEYYTSNACAIVEDSDWDRLYCWGPSRNGETGIDDKTVYTPSLPDK